MRRRLIHGGAWLLAGALLTFAVSTACAVWSGRDEFLDISFDWGDPPTLREEDRRWVADLPMEDDSKWTFGELRCFGYERVEFYDVPAWMGKGQGGGIGGGFICDLARTRCGWPLRAFECVDTRDDDDYGSGGRIYRHAIVVPVEVDVGGPVDVERPIPLRPLWPGFLADTALFGAAAWLLTLGPRSTRRILRERRGQCPRCGYPRGDGERCSECGRSF